VIAQQLSFASSSFILFSWTPVRLGLRIVDFLKDGIVAQRVILFRGSKYFMTYSAEM